MNKSNKLLIEKLDSKHERNNFDCGVEELNIFLKRYALQNQKRNCLKTYVCCQNNVVIGFYSLSFGEIVRNSAPPILLRGAGKYSIPSMILARLGVDKSEQNKGMGKALLKDAIIRTRQASEIAGLRTIVVHAKDESARLFYEKYGFINIPSNPLTMFFPLEHTSI